MSRPYDPESLELVKVNVSGREVQVCADKNTLYSDLFTTAAFSDAAAEGQSQLVPFL